MLVQSEYLRIIIFRSGISDDVVERNALEGERYCSKPL